MEKLLEIKHLSKSFGKRKVIDDVSFDVYGGEVFGFLGPNGAGKTTTIKMVMGFLFADSGEIKINGINVKKDYEKAMSYLGGIVENPEMYKYLSGRKNIEMYARIHDNVPKERVDEVINTVGMSARANEKIRRYSLGMKQRIGLAQALVHKPKVLILDEPTNGLDPAGIKELRDILKHLAHEEGIAVIVSSHMLSEMQLMCDRVGIITDGHLIGVKTVDELVNHTQTGEYTFIMKSDADSACALFKQKYPNHKAEIDGEKLTVYAAETDIPEINRLFAESGLNVYGIEKSGASLEEAFLSITGGGLDIA